jgi:hypothetical protein
MTLEIDLEFIFRWRERMNMNFDNNDEDRAAAIDMSYEVMETYIEAILERERCKTPEGLSTDAKQRYDAAQIIMKDFLEIKNLLED